MPNNSITNLPSTRIERNLLETETSSLSEFSNRYRLLIQDFGGYRVSVLVDSDGSFVKIVSIISNGSPFPARLQSSLFHDVDEFYAE